MNKKSLLFISLISALCILLFQNCGGGLGGGEFSSSAVSSSTGLINNEAPRLLNIPSNQTIYIGEGELSGSTRVNDLLVRADAGPNESNQMITLNCSASKNTIAISCNGSFDENGELRISIRHDNRNDCDSGNVTVTLEAEDSVPGNPNSPILTSAPRTFNVNMINNCLDFEKKIPEVADQVTQLNFGTTLATDGTYLAVAAPGDDTVAQDGGGIYIYKKESGKWNFKQKLNLQNVDAFDKVGSISINNDRLIVGNPYYDSTTRSEIGLAYIYERSGETWSLKITLAPELSNPNSEDQFGKAVAINGNWALVGTPQDSINDRWVRGAVYVYKRGASQWEFHSKIINSQTDNFDEFGKSLSMNANQFIVGAPAKFPNNSGKGHAYIYSLVNDDWVAQAQLSEINGKNSSEFGEAVAIDGDYAVVGAANGNGRENSSGSAYVYRKSNNNWSFQKELNASDGASGDDFGFSVSISGSDIVIGARKEDSGLDKQGAAYHFKWANNEWKQHYKIFARDRENRDYFGTSIVIHNGYTIVGSFLDDGNDNNRVDGLGAFYSLKLK